MASTGTAGTSPSEAADRKAIEAAWLQYWKVFTDMQKVPKGKRAQVYGTVTVDPQLSHLIKLAADNDKDHLGNYGTVVHRISWGPSVAGEKTAVIRDCQDERKFGAYDTKSMTIISHGVERVNVQPTFERNDSGWKVVAVLWLDKSC